MSTESPDPERQFYPLSKVTARISHYLKPAFGKRFWVRAEISSGRERGGTFYCDLVETDGRGKVIAKLACTIWSRDLARIRERFAAQGLTLSTDNGTVIGIECAVAYSPQYGLSLSVTDADPSVALGELELKKREILLRLRDERLGEPNKRLPVPTLPRRIGLITSKGSAAYSDFVNTLRHDIRFGFTILLADANMQGEFTEPSVLRALRLFRSSDVDLVVLVRGGGSKTDLYALDNETLAREIASLDRPVWTGIGHDIDTSVLDFVANRAFVTPTAVAEEIVARFVEMRRHIDSAQERIPLAWGTRLDRERDTLERMTTGLQQGSRKLLDQTRADRSLQAEQLRTRVSSRLAAASQRLAVSRQRLQGGTRQQLERSRARVFEWSRTLRTRVRYRVETRHEELARLVARWTPERFERPLAAAREDVGRRTLELRRKLDWRLAAWRTTLDGRRRTLEALDPKNSLRRGFALVYDDHGGLVKNVGQVSAGQDLSIQMQDGRIAASVSHTEESKDDQEESR